MAEERRTLLGLLESTEHEVIDKNQHSPDAAYWKIAVHFGRMEMGAHQRWAQETLAELRKLARGAESFRDSPGEKTSQQMKYSLWRPLAAWAEQREIRR
jgi:hypothetical protein